MDTSRILLPIVALSMLGLAGEAAPGQGIENAPVSAAKSTPAGEEPATPSVKQSEFVLLHDGRIIKGVLSEEDGMVIVTQPIGAMRLPKKKIERVFASMQEVYKYKLEQLPEDDFQERIKLARWCLEQKMAPQARQQLAAILERNPKHAQAKAMLVSLDQADVRLSNQMRDRDPGVRQTGGEQAEPVAGDRPGTLDASVISGAQRGMRISGLPVIFDLPPPQAVKRAEEFNRYVHPVLQTYCVRCHNENYEGAFQLVHIKTKVDRTPEAFRANLDATLRLIDRENPTRSELLSSSLRPHGAGPTRVPSFRARMTRLTRSWQPGPGTSSRRPSPTELCRRSSRLPVPTPQIALPASGAGSPVRPRLLACRGGLSPGPSRPRVFPPCARSRASVPSCRRQQPIPVSSPSPSRLAERNQGSLRAKRRSPRQSSGRKRPGDLRHSQLMTPVPRIWLRLRQAKQP